MLEKNKSLFKVINLSLLFFSCILRFGYVHSINKNLYKNLYYTYTDLIYFEQPLTNFINGHGLVDTGRGEDRSLFSEHTYFTHLLISLPIYYLFPHTLTLFSIATIHMLISLIIIFFLAGRYLENAALAWICYFIFLMNTFIQVSAGCFWRFGFHSEVYYLTYFLLFLYFWDKNKKIAVLSFFIALLTKETYSIPLFLTMFYFLIKNKGKKKTIIILMAISLLYFILATKLLIPLFGAGKVAYNYYAPNFKALKAMNIKMFLELFIHYWKLLLIHFHFLPVLSPLILILGLPESLINILSSFILNYHVPTNPASWHSIPVYGFLIWAYIETFSKLTKRIKKQIFVYLFSLVLISYSIYLFQYSPIPRLSHYRKNKDLLISMETVKKIVANSDSLCVEWDLGAPFMNKRYLYSFPINYQKTKYIVFRPKDKNFNKIKEIQYKIIFKTPQLVLLENLSLAKSKNSPNIPSLERNFFEPLIQRPGSNLTIENIHHRSQVKPSFPCPDRRNVRHPQSVHRISCKIPP